MLNLNAVCADSWSYRPYRPIMSDLGDITVCRIAPFPDGFEFEWLSEQCDAVELLLRVRGEGDFTLCGAFHGGEGRIDGLKGETDYEFMLRDTSNQSRTSRIRLVRTGDYLGVPVNYLHPDDAIYDLSGRYLCSPTIVKFNGALVASMDVFAPAGAQNLSLIFRSVDGGKSWRYLCDLFPCFWGKLFVYENAVWMLACSTEHGDILLSRSPDGGETFPTPTVLVRGSCHQAVPGADMSPEPPAIYGGRVWINYHYGSWQVGYHYPALASAPVGSDLLDIKNWTFTPALAYDPNWKGTAKGKSNGTLEGTFLEIADDGTDAHGSGLYMLARYGIDGCEPSWGLAILYKVDTADPSAPLSFCRTIRFDGNHSKFTVLYDEVGGRYYSIISRIRSAEHRGERNLLSLTSSSDGVNWSLVTDLIDWTDRDPSKFGLQYVDFCFDGDDILYICRTGVNGANSFHNTNAAIFKRVENFRSLLK